MLFLGGGGQIAPSPIDFHRRSYNTLALPCERVMYRHVVGNGQLSTAISDFSQFRVLKREAVGEDRQEDDARKERKKGNLLLKFRGQNAIVHAGTLHHPQR